MSRKTEQKRVIREVFFRLNRPLTANEVFIQAKKYFSGLGMATVYRNLKSMCDENWLKTVELPGESNRYERTGISHHHHFQCICCGKVFDIPGCPGNIERHLPEGYKATRHEVLIYGQCPECNIVEV